VRRPEAGRSTLYGVSLRALLLTVLLALVSFPHAAAAEPNCDVEDPPPICDRGGGPPEEDPGGGTTTTESVEFTLAVETERGKVVDGSGLECPQGPCSRTVGYERECTNGRCPPYRFLTVTLVLTPAPGYAATWDGCTPRAGDALRCDVRMDRNRSVRVLWTRTAEPGPVVNPEPVRDGGAVVPGDTAVAPGTAVKGSVVETPPAPGPRRVVRSSVRYSFRRTATWTEFTRLQVRHVPAGATTAVSCDGRRCPRRALVLTRSGSVKLNRFAGRRYPVGTTITIRVTHPRKAGRTTRILVRRGRDPQFTSRRA
jgi:hypothetical protein